MANYYPPVAFHFRVEIPDLGGSDNDMRFSEVGGLTMELGTEEVIEGGENRFVQKYPTRAKYPELVLKRGLLVDSATRDWIVRCVDTLDIEPKQVFVKLLNEQHQPLLTWQLTNAFPTKWSVADLNASSNVVVIESLQFYYQYFKLVR